MAPFNLSSLMKALGRQPEPLQHSGSATPAQPRHLNNRAVQDYLLRRGIPTAAAHSLAFNELAYWLENELDEVFESLDASPDEIQRGLLSFTVPTGALGGEDDVETFVKPTIEDIEKSVEVGGALCVNESGAFCVNPSGGYTALSHVWSQGIGADNENRGLRKCLLDQVFEKLRPLDIAWIWTDSLAIPGGRLKLSAREEQLKASLINCMPEVYQNAKNVVIFDALNLRLNSVDPLKVAVTTCMGVWMTRVWTYQEIKLANNAVLATGQGFVGFSAMCEDLEGLSRAEFGDRLDATSEGKHPSLSKALGRVRRDDAAGVSLVDVALGCANRDATDPLDRARAMFPTLGVTWRVEDDLHAAMRRLYEAKRHHATRLVLYHGPPRADLLGWAPAVFPGLVDGIVISPGRWMPRGMLRSWLTTRITGAVPSKPGSLVLELEGQEVDGVPPMAGGFTSEETRAQTPRALELFGEAVREGTAYLLSDEPLVPKRRMSRVGLVVQRFAAAEKLEAWVLFTLAIGETAPSYKRAKIEWLLLHENPVSENMLGGKGVSELRYAMEMSQRSTGPENPES